MDDETIRTAVGVRLGVALCSPHSCQLCREVVDELGLHGLSCQKSKGRIPRHTALNQLIKQNLASVHILSTLQPRGLCSSNECHPDGVTIIPWSQGKCLAWDVTCHDSFAPTNLPLTHTGAGLLANHVAEGKRDTYSELATMYALVPIAIETTGVYGDDALDFFKALGRRIREYTHDPISYFKLTQRVGVTIQRFNSLAIVSTCSI